MATYAQRTQAICDAIINGVSTQAQQLELAEALYSRSLAGPAFDTLTLGQKAEIIPAQFRSYALYVVRALRQAKAQAAAVDPASDFPEGV
jgi:hypothetical protein